MYEPLQFAVPYFKIVLGHGNRRLRYRFMGRKQVVDPDQYAGVIGRNVDEIEDDSLRRREPEISRHSPCCKMHTCGNGEAQNNSEIRPCWPKPEVSGKQEDKNEEPRLDQINS